ncbi:MAG: 50S ribosomal protein L10 [Patescibacteria group bacterium]|nr:50S ribosomal protein L10 [Patescibacteria group bacterium]
MAISRKKKEELVEEVAGKIKDSKSIVFADFTGLSVDEISELRAKLREQGVGLKVVKHNLFALAASKAGADIDIKELAGHPVAFAFSTDEVLGAKTINDFAKGNEKLTMLGAALEGKNISMDELKTLANMPSREELYAKVVGSLASPLRGMVGVLSGNLRGLVSVLNQYADSRK